MANTGNLYKHYVGNGTFTVYTGGGFLDAVWINIAGGAGSTITVFEGEDTINRPIIGVIDASSIHKHDWKVNARAITMVIGGNATAPDLTVTFDGVPT